MNNKIPEIKELINGWNMNKYSAVSRDALRQLLGWNVETDDGLPLADLIEQEFLTHFETIHRQQNIISPPKLERNQEFERVQRKYTDFIKNLITTSEMAKIVLSDSWDFIDPRGRMRKRSEEVQDFLTEVSYDTEFYKDMHPLRLSLFKTILDSWQAWALRQKIKP